MAIYKRGGCDKAGPKGNCSKCGKKKGSCGAYWYKFMWNGELVRESTRQGSDNVARQMEAAHRTSLAKGEVGIREKKVAPSLSAFCDQRLEPWAKSSFEKTSRANWLWYRTEIRALLSYRPLASARLKRHWQRTRSRIRVAQAIGWEAGQHCEWLPSRPATGSKACKAVGSAGRCSRYIAASWRTPPRKSGHCGGRSEVSRSGPGTAEVDCDRPRRHWASS